jgi:hypothetical protein
MTSILLDTTGGNTMDLGEGKKKQYLNQLGGRDDQMMNQ